MTEHDEAAKAHFSLSGQRNAPVPAVGQALDGRHFLDVVEEQQYTGKPFVPNEQNVVLETDGGKSAAGKG